MTRYLGPKAPIVSWDFEHIDGTVFEDRIVEHLQEFYSAQRGAVTVEGTKKSGDHGRDAVIIARCPITVFGVEIPQRPDRPTRVNIECKLRTDDRLEESFFFDFAQFRDGDLSPDYYFLVTTASLTPNVHYKAAEECRARGVVFRVIDRVLLAEYASRHDLAIGLREPIILPDEAIVEYQTEPSFYLHDRRIDLYIIAWNYSRDTRSLHVNLATNETWTIVEGPTNVDRIVEPRAALQLHLIAQRRTREDNDVDLEITVTVQNEQRRLIKVVAPHIHLAFQPVLFGDAHHDAVRELQSRIDTNRTTVVVSITGHAGVGKSRVVEEALGPWIGKSNIDVATVFFDAAGGADPLRAAMKELKIAQPTSTALDVLVTHLLQHASRDGRNRVVLFEDLHHAPKRVIDALKRFILKPPHVDSPLTVLVTGRNDDTFPNDDYYSLLDVIALGRAGHTAPIELFPLSSDDTKKLIRSTLREAPNVVVERIHALSENVPFHVIQAIEYLLESGVAHLHHRNQVGIDNLTSFSAKDYIPATIEQLYELRLAALGALPHGPAMLDFLLTQSFFGFFVKPIVMREAFDPDAADEILATLIDRRFLAVQLTDGSTTFAHENLLAVLRARARRNEYRERAGKLVLSRPALFRLLDDLDRGEVQYLARRFDAALNEFDRIVTKVRSIDNFSSEDLDVRFFRYIDAVFDCAVQCDAEPDLLQKILLAKAYMGIHNYLAVGVRACDTALEQLRRVQLSVETRSIVELEIRQLQAHGLLNMGETLKASGIMFELDQFLRSNTDRVTAPELVFDVYDRLQELYKKWNHEALARSYGGFARRVAEESGNGKLLACHAITEAGMDLYRNPSKAQKNATWSHDLCATHGAFRLKVYTRLSTYVTQALADPTPTNWRTILPKATRLIRDAQVSSLSDSLMRAHLLVATLMYLLDPHDLRVIARAENHVRAGIDSCVKFGNGLYSWLLYNLSGVLREARNAKAEEVWEQYSAARRDLDLQNLFFVGRKDCTYPTVFVISNIVRFRAFYDHLDALKILGCITDYDSERSEHAREKALHLVCSKTRLFFRPHRRPKCFVDPNHQYWLPIL